MSKNICRTINWLKITLMEGHKPISRDHRDFRVQLNTLATPQQQDYMSFACANTTQLHQSERHIQHTYSTVRPHNALGVCVCVCVRSGGFPVSCGRSDGGVQRGSSEGQRPCRLQHLPFGSSSSANPGIRSVSYWTTLQLLN